MPDNRVYSPAQAALGAFLGGPLASFYFIQHNFSILRDEESARKTILYGTLTVSVLLAALPFLPDKFPNFLIPCITIFATRYFIEKFQFSKEDITTNDAIGFQSNWRVFFIGLFSLAIFTIIAIGVIFGLSTFDIISIE